MDFGALPPEINSGRMYSGPGSAPMLAAAAGWDQLAGELYSAAASYSSAISGLTGGSWKGPASASMAAAAATYVAWMGAAATQAEQAATQARVAASAFESALAATVPPPLIAANRAQLAMLVATNLLGINTPAIMATEVHYAEMWAQDAATMYGYAGSSAAAATLTPFTAPQQNTNPAGLAAQGAAVTNSGVTQAGTSVETIVGQILDNINNALEPDTVNSGSALSQRSRPSSCRHSRLFRPAQFRRDRRGLDGGGIDRRERRTQQGGEHARVSRVSSGRRCGVCRDRPGDQRRRAVGAADLGTLTSAIRNAPTALPVGSVSATGTSRLCRPQSWQAGREP